MDTKSTNSELFLLNKKSDDLTEAHNVMVGTADRTKDIAKYVLAYRRKVRGASSGQVKDNSERSSEIQN